MSASRIKNTFLLRLVISQYDYDHYSRCMHTVFRDVEPDSSGVIHFGVMEWKYRVVTKPVSGNENGQQFLVEFELLKGIASQCNVAVEFVFNNWSVDHYVLMPAAAYNGNRFESRRIAYSPKLLDPRDIGPDKEPIISDVPRLAIHDGPSCIDERSGAMSTPSMGFYSPEQQSGCWLFTPQKSALGDYGYRIRENRRRDQAQFRISAPVVRELYKYRITDNRFPSDDKAPDWKVGNKVEIPIQIYCFDCPSIQSLFDRWNQLRYNLIPKPEPVSTFPFSSTFAIQEGKFNTHNWVDKHGYYSVGMREMFLQDWQLGWTGGMITTYPLLFEGTEETRRRVVRNFDFLFPNGISPSGFFYDSGETKEDGFHWYGGDIRKPHTANWHLIRKSGDGLYYIIKQFWLMNKLGIDVKPVWSEGAKTVADAFVKLWKKYGQTGNFVDSISGEIRVGGSTSAGIAPAALAYASVYYQHAEYITAAKEMAGYFYEKYITKGLTMGGVGDAMQNPDSESAYGVLESFSVLYEQTGDPVWLKRAEEMANQFFSWVIGFNYEFSQDCTLGKLGVKTLGAVYANTQNKHGAPGICTFSGVALLRLFRATGNMLYLEVLRDIARFIPQLFAFPQHPIPGMQTGWITERVSTTDWFEGIGELMIGSTWAETSLMLTQIEIPGIYVLPDQHLVFALDAVETKIVSKSEKKIVILVKNPSKVDATVKILVETSVQRLKALGENYLYQAENIFIKSKEEAVVSLFF